VNAKRIFHENWTYYERGNLFVSGLNQKITDPPTFSSYYIENGAYAKLDNLTIGYTIPVKSNYFKSLRVYFTGANLLTITDFSGTDPELQINYFPPQDPNQETDEGPGLESNYIYYPSTRVYTLGVNINF
jgi:hypothetical protein